MSLAYKRPALWAPGVIPTVEFLVYGFAGAVKKRRQESRSVSATDSVMARLVPAIHAFLQSFSQDVDARDKPGMTKH